ncbi:class I SAM-dependent methyltransferase [Kiritimatiellaeota bacterium B1221]|nr:class I SAM-dependent methyltransferase [Kiritimatiellaeota bacterium B1221]
MNSSFTDSLNKSLALQAKCTENPSAWMGHIPFAHWLGLTLKPDCFVELGTHYGHSFFNLCEGIKQSGAKSKCYAIDTWTGDPQAGLYTDEVFQQVSNLQQKEYAEFSTLLKMTFDEGSKKFEPESIQLLHIDGHHSYESVSHDFHQWKPFLKPDATVLFHDTQEKKFEFGVWKFWKELCDEYEYHFEFLHSSGLGVLQLSNPDDHPLNPFWQEVRSNPEWIQDHFRFRSNFLTEGTSIADLQKIPLPQYDSEILQLQYQGARAELSKKTKELESAAVNIRHLNDRLVVQSHLANSIQGRQTEQQRIHDEQSKEISDLKCRLQLTEESVTNLHSDPGQLLLCAFELSSNPFSTYFQWLRKLNTHAPRICMLVAAPAKFLEWSLSGHFIQKVKNFQAARKIVAQGLFDPIWYLMQNRDVLHSGQNPIFHWLETGWKENRLPHPDIDTRLYLENYPDVANAGINPLVHYVNFGITEGRVLPQPASRIAHTKKACAFKEFLQPPKSVPEILQERFPNQKALPIYTAQDQPVHLNLITDSINAGSLFGGVGTALLLGVKIANNLNLSLRVVTTQAPPHTQNIPVLLQQHKVDPLHPITYDHVSEPKRALPVHEDDLYLTTSWWTTRQTLQKVRVEKIIYLLQEDERMFYPHGDDWLRCHEILSMPNLKKVVNSKLLYDFLCQNGCESLQQTGTYFEPVFLKPQKTNHHKRSSGEKRNFLFYARPNHSRNLFYRGLEVIQQAITEGYFAPEEWDFYFAGHDIPNISLPGNMKIQLLQNLNWQEYSEKISTMDLGFCLMLSPHPSYPPLDLTSVGAQVVTNQFANKRSLENYDQNIIVVPPGKEDLLQGLKSALQKLQHPASKSRSTPSTPSFEKSWQETFSPVIQWLKEHL